MLELPWSDCKVAYGIDDEDALEVLYYNESNLLPEGWEYNETDCSGARCVVVFRVNCLLTIKDGEATMNVLKELGAIKGD